MIGKKSLDVLVVGAGPVGLFCANELNRQGLNCRIIDKKSELSDKSKALGLHIRTLDVFEDCGFLDEIIAQGLKVHGIVLSSGGKPLFEATFDHVEANRNFLIDLPQDKTERILFAELKKKKIPVEWETELTEVMQNADEVRTILTKKDGSVEHVTSKWLIACDGGHSTVRELAKMPFEGAEYKENWWLADLFIDWEKPEDKMFMYASTFGPMACFPMGSKRYRLVLTAPWGETKDPSFEDIVVEFNRRTEERATLSNPIWFTKFYLHHRQIQSYRQKRLFFAGDAAHIHSPMGGQGMNTGLQDIYNLAWKLALVHKGLALNSLLDSYQLERHPVGAAVLKETDFMTKMVTIKNPLAVKVRNLLLSFIMSFSAVRNKMATQIAELQISYANSPIVKDLAQSLKFKAGKFLVSFYLRDEEDNVAEYKSITAGIQHHLFLFSGMSGSTTSQQIAIAASINEHFRNTIVTHFVMMNKPGSDVFSGKIWIDKDAAIHKKFAISQPCALLIRPDKYIGFVQMPIEESALFDYLNKIFIPT